MNLHHSGAWLERFQDQQHFEVGLFGDLAGAIFAAPFGEAQAFRAGKAELDAAAVSGELHGTAAAEFAGHFGQTGFLIVNGFFYGNQRKPPVAGEARRAS